MEIRLRYRRSIIGPWWITISTSLMIILLSVLWSKVFGLDLNEYVPYFSIGLILWNLFMTQNLDATTLFLRNENLMKEIYISPIEFILSSMTSNLIIFLHNFVVILFIFFFFDLQVTISLFISFLGFILYVLFIFFVSATISIISVRFRDAVQIFSTLLNLLFFISPIIWKSESIKGDFILLKFNPMYHFLELIRKPMIDGLFDLTNFLYSILFLAIAFLFFVFLYKKHEENIVFWI